MPPSLVHRPLRGKEIIPIGKETVGKKFFPDSFFINLPIAATFSPPGQSNMQKLI